MFETGRVIPAEVVNSGLFAPSGINGYGLTDQSMDFDLSGLSRMAHIDPVGMLLDHNEMTVELIEVS